MKKRRQRRRKRKRENKSAGQIIIYGNSGLLNLTSLVNLQLSCCCFDYPKVNPHILLTKHNILRAKIITFAVLCARRSLNRILRNIPGEIKRYENCRVVLPALKQSGGKNAEHQSNNMVWSPGVFTAFSFIVCVLYGLVASSNLRMYQFLQNVLPGFK